MECSNTIDTLGKRCRDRGIHTYLYKNVARILPLAMVDDILGIQECGKKSIEMNTFINTHIEMKKLSFHTPNTTGRSKCHKLHVGKHNPVCPELRVHGTPMECVESDVYLGDVISASGSNTQNIKARISRGKGIALLLGQSLFLSSILTYSESW